MKCKMGKKIILLYHRVDETTQDYNRITVSEDNFRKQMEYLKQNHQVADLKEVLTYEGQEDVIAVTFDDGFADFYTKALPVLEQCQIPATVFITTGKMKTREELWTTEILRLLYQNPSGCEEVTVKLYEREIPLPVASLEQRAEAYRIIRHLLMQLSGEAQKHMLQSIRCQLGMEEKGREGYLLLSEEQCRQLGRHPLVTVGAHTVNHISMGRVSQGILEYEIRESMKQLKAMAGREIDYFAYPFGGRGDYSGEVMELLKHYGVKAAFTVANSSYEEQRHGTYEIPRYYVGNWEIDRFKEWMEGILLSKECEKPGLIKSGFYMGRLHCDRQLLEGGDAIIIWGTGVRAKRIREALKEAGQQDRIIGFGENNASLWGDRLDGIEIWSPEEVKEHRDAAVVINNSQDMGIYQQLVCLGVEKIHWII